MGTEQQFIQGLLPKNYVTTKKFNGVYCHCINQDGMPIEFFEKVIHFVKIKYGPRFTDFNYVDTVTEAKLSNRHQFTIYLKP